jgi:Alpha/beta hydrolase domain
VFRVLTGFLVGSMLAVVPLAGTPQVNAASQTSGESNPVVTGPITGGLHGRPWFGTPFDVADYGYSQNEYFFSGTAKAYGTSDPPAAYETRMLVYAPTNPAKFSGKVIVEWNNVTTQMDLPADFTWLYPQIFSSGDAYVEVSAQQAGICGAGLSGQPVLSVGSVSASVCTPTSLKGYDPERYAPLFQPGDQYSYDIFSQAAQAIRHPEGISPLGNLHVQKLIAIGESQSAMELDQYISTGADAAAKEFDGFAIDADVHETIPTSYRVPTIHIWGEESAQPVGSTSGPNHVIWEVAGAAHSDYWMVQQALSWIESSLLSEPPISMQQEEADQQAYGNYGQEGPGVSATCAGDTEFPRRYVVDAALTDLENWVNTGDPAPTAPPLLFTGLAQATQPLPSEDLGTLFPPGVNLFAWVTAPLALQRDAEGNALGGLRLPMVTVPVASYEGSTCVLLGTSEPLPSTQLLQLYPTHDDYVADLVAATKSAVNERYMTVSDGVDLLSRACGSAIPYWGTTPVSQQPEVCSELKTTLSGST